MMLCRVVLRTLDLRGVRSPALLTLGTLTRKPTRCHLWVKGCPKPQSGLRCLSSGHCLGSREPGDYASDPQVKEWLKELHKDFSHQPQQENLSTSKAKEGKENTTEEDVAGDMTEREKQEERKEGGNTPVKGKLLCCVLYCNILGKLNCNFFFHQFCIFGFTCC